MRARAFLAFLCLAALPVLAVAGPPIIQSDDGAWSSEPTAEQKQALAEMEAKIVKLKAEGKLPDSLPAPSATTTAAATSASAPDGCTRLAVGASAVVNYSFESSPTGVSAQYGLSRPKDSVYLVEVNLQFEKGSGFPDEITPKDINSRYHDRVVACLKEFEGALKNERAGKSMVLRLTDNPAVPVTRISVVGAGARSNSAAWASNISCPAALHEIMHVLGLTDEYNDTPELHDPLVDCRAVGPTDSLMSNHWEAAESIKPQTAYAVQMCKCDVKGNSCWQLSQKNHLSGTACPPGTTGFLKDLNPDMKASFNVFDTSEAFALNEAKVATGITPAPHTSILYPAHFRAITEPGCHDVNDNYYKCVANSYRSSRRTASGVGGEGCLPKPEACRWGSNKWLE